jgi:hypothetical protein
MRVHRILAALAATLIGLVGGAVLVATPAHAGNWAVTVLDPVPDRWDAEHSYTVGLWVLQHGFHPFEGGDLGPVALRLVDDKGVTLFFPAVALAEPAHYAAALAVPHAGTWTVIGVQGRFADYHVGTLTVPGALTVLGVPAPLKPADIEKYWPGAIRPPVVVVDGSRDPFAPVAVAAPLGADVAPVAHDVPAPPAPVRTSSLLALALGIGVIAVAVVASRRRSMRQRRS